MSRSHPPKHLWSRMTPRVPAPGSNRRPAHSPPCCSLTPYSPNLHHLLPAPVQVPSSQASVEPHDPRAFLRPVATGGLPTVPERTSTERSGSVPLEASSVSLTAAASGTSRTTALAKERCIPCPAWGEGAGDSAGAVPTQASSSSEALLAGAPSASHHALHSQGPSSHCTVPSAHPLGQQHHQHQQQHQQQQQQQQHHSSKHSHSGSSGSSVQFLPPASKPSSVGKSWREGCCADESSAEPAERPVREADSPPARPKKKMGLCGLF